MFNGSLVHWLPSGAFTLHPGSLFGHLERTYSKAKNVSGTSFIVGTNNRMMRWGQELRANKDHIKNKSF